MAKVWKDYPNTTTPLTAAELNRIETEIETAQTGLTAQGSQLTTLQDDYTPFKAATTTALTTVTSKVGNFAAKTIAATQTVILGTLTVTLAAPAQVLVQAGAQVRPAGNGAGTLIIKRNGTTIASQAWHSENTSYHQWPTCIVGIALAAGTHTLTVSGDVGAGSNTAVYDRGSLTAITLGA